VICAIAIAISGQHNDSEAHSSSANLKGENEESYTNRRSFSLLLAVNTGPPLDVLAAGGISRKTRACRPPRHRLGLSVLLQTFIFLCIGAADGLPEPGPLFFLYKEQSYTSEVLSSQECVP